MKPFFLDGVETDCPVDLESSLYDLFLCIERTCSLNNLVIVKILVDGIELVKEQIEDKLRTPLSKFSRIEMFTRLEPFELKGVNKMTSILDSQNHENANPRDLAYESLEDLMRYCPYLIKLCHQAANQVHSANFFEHFLPFIEGIGIFTEAIKTIKSILHAHQVREIGILEADLLSILRDIHNSHQAGQQDYIQELLREHLAVNLQDWQDLGLPQLIRMRVC